LTKGELRIKFSQEVAVDGIDDEVIVSRRQPFKEAHLDTLLSRSQVPLGNAVLDAPHPNTDCNVVKNTFPSGTWEREK